METTLTVPLDLTPDLVVAVYNGVSRALTAPGAPFATATAGGPGRPVHVFVQVPNTVDELLRLAEQRLGNRPFLHEDGRSTSYADVFSAAANFATILRVRHGVGHGDHVGILMRNRAEWLIGFVAAMRLGAVAVLFNSRAVGTELKAAVDQAGCIVIVADDERVKQLAFAAVEVAAIRLGAMSATVNAIDPDQTPPMVGPESPAAILFTSGTSGGARAVALTHRNLVNMDRNIAFIAEMSNGIEAELLGISPTALKAASPRPVGLLIFPFFHVSGLTAFFRTLAAGGEMVLMRRWDPVAAIQLIETHRITQLSGPPLVLSDLLDCADDGAKLQSINALVIGGQAILPGLVERAARMLPRAGFSIGWGMTEVTGAVTASVGSLYRARPQSCGVQLPLTEIRTCSEEGVFLPPGEIGELYVGGALVMDGYFGAPEATASVLHDGWLRTGDVGWVDADGFVYLIDRKKDIVICGGENIYCGEVERVLGAHTDVAEALVFGVPDARTGERLIAAVRLRDTATATAASLVEAMRPHLAAYKVPAEIVFDLPMRHNATGKVSKAELRLAMMQRAEAGRQTA